MVSISSLSSDFNTTSFVRPSTSSATSSPKFLEVYNLIMFVPAPPVIESLPSPPSRVSSPIPPRIVSLLSEPVIESLPAPPSSFRAFAAPSPLILIIEKKKAI